MSPAEERWHSLMLDASSGKLGAPFPEGQLTDMQILEPTEGEFFCIVYVVPIGSSYLTSVLLSYISSLFFPSHYFLPT